ncbi:hypothetical protein ARMSODRAFT_1017816 [Armillaria solidipes]|uniref:Uncharacterized protein n=1 Tax=Armillaria solidipes TaxID=1076256 RepID=A0A2H3BN10_9AGAR|nr:hypothetical protein ARMSODRAFT_1017816 [Armillaria solidipes]
MYPGPPCPPWRQMTGTYGLGTNSFHLLPMTQVTYHPQSGPSYPSDPVPSWLSPLRPLSASSYNPPPAMFPLLSPAAQRMISQFPKDSKHLHHDTPVSPRPLGQPEGSQNEPLPSTPTSRVPSPALAEEVLSPQSLQIPLPAETVTLSTLMGLTMSGLCSPPLTEKSLAPTAPRPGSYEDVMSRLASISEAPTKTQWTGTSLWHKAILSQSNEDEMPLSWPGYSPIKTDHYMVLHLAINYMDDLENAPYQSSRSWRPAYEPLPDYRTRQTDEVIFDHFNYDHETFGGYTPDPYETTESYTPGISQITYPFPLPNSPLNHKVRQHGQYHSPRYSRQYAGQDDNNAGGSQQPPNDPPQPSNEERTQVAVKEAEE